MKTVFVNKWLFIIFSFILILLVKCSNNIGNDLYFYSSKSFNRFFNKIGYNDFWKTNDMYISRNANGTALRFIRAEMKKVIIINCDGSIKEFSIPGAPAWFNENNELIAWFNMMKNNEIYVNYKNGFSEERSFGPFCGPDPSGTYFIKYPIYSKGMNMKEYCVTSIYSIDHPSMLLKEISVCGDLNTKIYYNNNFIYLFGEDYYKQSKDIRTMYVLQVENKKATEVNKIYIERPNKSSTSWTVIDYCTWNKEVLLMDHSDFPNRGTYYLYNLKSNNLIKLCKEPLLYSVWEFYLKSDVIKDFLINFKKI